MSKVKIVEYQDPNEFLMAASDFLYKNEAVNSLILGILARYQLRSSAAPNFWIAFDADAVVSAATYFNSLPFYLNLTTGPDDVIKELANVIVRKNLDVRGITAPLSTERIFIPEWNQINKVKPISRVPQKLMTLEKVNPVDNVPGKMIQANETHIPLLIDWFIEFFHESLPHETPTVQIAGARMRSFIDAQLAFIWENDHRPVAMVMGNRPTKNGISVSFVYTPLEYRNRGFALAVTAAVSDLFLSRGKTFCALYTDANNPTSNKIYQKIGYREIAETTLTVYK